MIQAAKFYFKAKAADLDGGALNKLYGGLALLAMAVGMYFWYLHLDAKHHVHNVAAKQVAPANPAPAKITPAAPAAPAAPPVVAPATPPPAPGQVAVAVAAPVVDKTSISNSVPAKDAPGSLGDSLLSVITPSAKAETAQPAFDSLKAPDATVIPAARVPLRVSAPARPKAPLTDQQKLVQAAQDRLDRIIDMASKNPDIFGFSPEDKFDLVKLGDPIPVYTVPSAARDTYQEGQPIKALLQPVKQWLFPVVLNDEVRVLVPVRRVGNDYIADNCSRALAMVYEKIQNRWPASEGYHPQLVVNPNMTGYFFTVPELSIPNLTDTSEMFEYNPSVSPASVILASWK